MKPLYEECPNCGQETKPSDITGHNRYNPDHPGWHHQRIHFRCEPCSKRLRKDVSWSRPLTDEDDAVFDQLHEEAKRRGIL